MQLPRIILAAGLLATALLSSCAPSISVPAAFWQERKAKVVVAIAKTPDGGHLYKTGNQGILDIAISSAVTKGPDSALRKVDRARFSKVRDTFVTELRKRGMNAAAMSGEVDCGALPKNSKGGMFLDGRDYSSILSAQKADYLIVLRMPQYGAVRSYYGFIPISKPVGMAHVDGVMVQKEGSKAVWFSGSTGIQSLQVVEGEWDEAPEYRNLVNATVKAVDASQQLLKEDFFH